MAEGFNDALLNVGNAAMQTAAAYAALYTAEPNSAGTTNTTTAARQAVSWDTAANGDMVLTTDIPFTGGAASGACTFIGFWSASTGGTYYGGFALDGDATFNAAGEYTVTGGTVTGSSTGA